MDSNNLIPSESYQFSTYQEYRNTVTNQMFSIPSSAIYYISKNPSTPKAYQRLIKSCKYFFTKNPILVIRCLKFNENEWKMCKDASRCDWPNISDKKFELNLPRISSSPWELKLMKISAKIWITKHFSIYNGWPVFASKVIKNIYKCDATILDFYGQTLFFNEFLFYASNVKELLLLDDNKILSCNGSEVLCETVFASLPGLIYFFYKFNENTARHASTSIKELVKVPHFKNLKIFGLSNVSDLFDIDTFYESMKEKKKIKGYLQYKYNVPLSDAYRIKLQEIVDELLTKESFDFYPIFITFPGGTSMVDLWKLHDTVKID